MNEAFWLMWKTTPPILVLIVLVFAVKYHDLRRQIAGLEQKLADSKERGDYLVRRLALAQIDAAEAKSLANILRQRDEATCPCSEVKADRERIAYLTERNNQLMFDALSNNAGKYIKINRN